ncbi:hypothetical protein LXL04_025324 [Taraxacum kok-saghyz]
MFLNFYRNIYNTYLKGFVKKILKKTQKKKVAHMQKLKKKVAYMQKVKKNIVFSDFFFQRIIMIINVLEGPEVGFFERNNGLGSGEKEFTWRRTEKTQAKKKRRRKESLVPLRSEKGFASEKKGFAG